MIRSGAEGAAFGPPETQTVRAAIDLDERCRDLVRVRGGVQVHDICDM